MQEALGAVLTVCLIVSPGIALDDRERSAMFSEVQSVWQPHSAIRSGHADSCGRLLQVKSDAEARPEDITHDSALGWVPFVAGGGRLVPLRASRAHSLIGDMSPGTRPEALTRLPCASVQEVATPTMSMLAYNYAGVPGDVLRGARDWTTAILRDAGVDAVWREPLAERGASVGSSTTDSLFTVRMLIRPRRPEWDPSRQSVMGLALASDQQTAVISLFYDAVMKVAFQYRQSAADVLGIAMAHEIGHALLPPPSHAPTGIMRGSWDGGNVQEALWGPRAFTPTQADFIRRRVRGCSSRP